jgi:DNA polymerase
MTLIDPEFKISKKHGQWYNLGGVRAMAIYHPAALLRDPNRRPETFVDLKTLQAEIKNICGHTL